MWTAVRLMSLAAGFVLLGTTCGLAQNASANEARAMLDRAIASLKHDEAGTLAEFMSRTGGFRDRDLYVFCYDTADGKFQAHVNPAMLGRDIRTLKERDGSPLGQRIFDANKPDQMVTVDYKAPRPNSSEPVPKQALMTIVGRLGCGVTYYK